MNRAWLPLLLLLAALAVGGAFWGSSSGSSEEEQAASPPTPATQPARSQRQPRPWAGAALPEVGDAGVPGKETRVRVLGANDVPLPGARVLLTQASRPTHHGFRRRIASATTDADGWAVFLGVPADFNQVEAHAPFFRPFRGPWVEGATIRLAPLPPMRGRVLLPSRLPAAGAVVTTETDEPVQTLTGQDGRFVLPVPVPGALVAERDGLSGRFTGAEALEAGEIEIVLGPNSPAVGKVVQRSGTPLAGVEVEVRVGGSSKRFLTGPDGVWRGSLFDGASNQLRYSRQGYVPVTQLGYRPAQEAIVLSRPGRIDGHFVTSAGAPIAGAPIRTDGQELITDASGGFSIEQISEPAVTLFASHADEELERTVEVPEGQTVAIELMAPPALLEVALEVVDGEGSELAGWLAVATPIPAEGWESRAFSYQALRLSRGRFRIEVTDLDRQLRGEVTLHVDPAASSPIRVVLRGLDGGSGLRRPSDPRVQAGTLEVRVLNATGAPVPGAAVLCGYQQTQTGADGTAQCAIFGDEEGAIVVSATNGEATALAHVSGRPSRVELTLRPPRTIRGTVLGPLPPAAYLELNSAAESAELELATHDFVLERRAAVRTVLCLMQRIPAASSIRHGCAIVQGDERVVIPVGAPGTVNLTLLDEQGQPLEHPTLYVDRAADTPFAPNGKLSLVLVPGSHVLVLNAKGSSARAEVIFTVRSGEVTELPPLKMQ